MGVLLRFLTGNEGPLFVPTGRGGEKLQGGERGRDSRMGTMKRREFEEKFCKAVAVRDNPYRWVFILV